MATVTHEALVMLLRRRPALAAELLADALGVALPDWREAQLSAAELSDLEPAPFRADLVVLLVDREPVAAIVVEVQLAPDPDKRRRWPQYLTTLRAELGCPGYLLVLAPDEAVARWCARPIAVGHPGFVLRPLVVGPDAVPVVADLEQARGSPELAVLSAMAHGRGERALGVALAALGAVAGLDDARARLYYDLVVASLGEAARQALEAMMETGGYEYQSEFARRYVAQGRAEGEAKGRAEGEAKGRAEALLAVLRARGLQLSPAAEQRIATCTDLAQLDEWIGRALTVGSAEGLFD